MKFATIGHLLDERTIEQFPRSWIQRNLIVSPEININETKGHLTGVTLTARQMMELPKETVRKSILDAALYIQNELNVDLIQLGGLTTSVTNGGIWVTQQKEYTGFVNHGDSYTAAIACQVVHKATKLFHKNLSDLTLSVVGAYGVIGEAISKILVPQFAHSILIGRREDKLKELGEKLDGDFETTLKLTTRKADIIVTATSHPDALLQSEHLCQNAIVVDISQPPNLSYEVCQQRPDIHRIDGGYVNFPSEIHIPGLSAGKLFACISEVIMQAMENEQNNHVGSIDLNYLRKTEKWGEKYNFILKELTNFGQPIRQNKKE